MNPLCYVFKVLKNCTILQRRAIDAPMRKKWIKVEGTKRGRERPKIILAEVIKRDMLIKEHRV